MTTIQTQLERHVFRAAEPGPTLVVTARIHGNEPSGEIAARRVIDEISSGNLQLQRGQLIIYPVLNPFAKERNVRGVWIDTNRAITPRAKTLAAVATPEHGLRANIVDELQKANILSQDFGSEWHALDLHSVPKDGEAHTILSEGKHDLALAYVIGAPTIYSGWRTAYQKVDEADLVALGHSRQEHNDFTTALIYAARDLGAKSSVCLESGQDDHPSSVAWAYQGIRNALNYFGITDAPLANQLGGNQHITQTVFDQVLIRRNESEKLVGITQDAQPVKPGQTILAGATREVTVPNVDRNWHIAHPIDADVGRHCGFLAYTL